MNAGNKTMKQVTIYTDGACSGNPGPGGWAALLIYGEARKMLRGGEKLTTNNRMELTAAIKALEALKVPCSADIYSDSSYLVDAHDMHWLDAWQKNNWRRKKAGTDKNEKADHVSDTADEKAEETGKPVLNADLWKQLLALEKKHVVRWHKVSGHAGVSENELCDKAAVEQSCLFRDS